MSIQTDLANSLLDNSLKHALTNKSKLFKIHCTAFDGISNYRELAQIFAEQNHLMLEYKSSYLIFHIA